MQITVRIVNAFSLAARHAPRPPHNQLQLQDVQQKQVISIAYEPGWISITSEQYNSHRPLSNPACLRLLNGERNEILKTADLVVKLRKGGREYDLGRVETQVIDEEGWKDVVIGEDTLRRLGWMPDQIAFPLFPNTPTFPNYRLGGINDNNSESTTPPLFILVDISSRPTENKTGDKPVTGNVRKERLCAVNPETKRKSSWWRKYFKGTPVCREPKQSWWLQYF